MAPKNCPCSCNTASTYTETKQCSNHRHRCSKLVLRRHMIISCIWTTCWQVTFPHAQMQYSLVSSFTATLGKRNRHQHASDKSMCVQDIGLVLHQTDSYTDTDETTGTLRHINRLLHERGSYTDIDESTGNLRYVGTNLQEVCSHGLD